MARGKKKEAVLSPAERLQAALVPESEQPYQAPKNWCWTRVGELTIFYKGVSYKKQDAHPEKNSQDYLILRGGNVLEGTIVLETNDNVYVNHNLVRNEQLLQQYDIIIVSSTGSSKVIGRAGISNKDYTDVAFGAFLILVRPNNKVVKPFIAYYFQSNLYRNRIRDLASGVNINNIKVSYITESPIPFPPLPEQQRIVDRIESLFAKLDEAKQKAQDALDSFETRKAAILHKAFTGELTAQWRKEHGVGMEGWKNSTVGQVCRYVKVGIVIKPSQYYTDKEEGTPAFRSANVRENHIDDFEWVYLNRAGMENNSRSVVHTGDVLVVRSGNPGTACVVSEKFDGYNAIDILIAVPDHSQISSEYLCNYTNSPFGKTLIFENKRGMALAHFNVKDYSELPIRVPQLNEQTEIVRILDNLLTKEQQAKEAAEKVLKQIDLTKKAILARAFRGELGTNDPSEESAVELLKTCYNG